MLREVLRLTKGDLSNVNKPLHVKKTSASKCWDYKTNKNYIWPRFYVQNKEDKK